MSTAAAPRVHCRVFAGSQARGAFALWWMMMTVLFGTMLIGFPPPLAVLLMLGVLYYGLRRLSGTATYTLNGDRIERHYISFSKHSERRDERRLRDLKRWKFDHTISRGYQKFEYLELDAVEGPRWIITSRQDVEGFTAFKDAFLAELARQQLTMSTVPKQRPSYYRTWYGRLMTLFFVTMSAGLIFAAGGGLVAVAGIIKLGIVIIPGTIYLLWRSFGPQR
jgi:hypothetical protein